MQTSAMKVYFHIAECRLSYAKVVKGEHNGKERQKNFAILCIVEPPPTLSKGNKNCGERPIKPMPMRKSFLSLPPQNPFTRHLKTSHLKPYNLP